MQEDDSKSLVFKTQVLYARAANGKLLTWQAYVFKNEDNTASVLMTSGYVGGTLKEAHRRYDRGKNAGKKNCTSAVQQAVAETESRFKKQQDKGYRLSTNELGALPVRPMLAQSYMDNADKLDKSTIYIAQPKLDGVRCTVQRNGDTLVFMSRTCKTYDLLNKHTKLVAELLEVMPDGDIWDGEIYIHGLPLQDIVSAVKAQGPNTKKLQYWVYDIINDHIQIERTTKYRALLADRKFKFLVPCPVDYVKGVDNIKAKQEAYLLAGYEGLMLRGYSAKYRQGFRSKDLLKMKDYSDTEYKITGFSNDVNGCIIFEFFNQGKPFSSVPCWAQDQRKAAYRKGCEDSRAWIGKQATVRCCAYSKTGVPTGCPVVVAVRDYE